MQDGKIVQASDIAFAAMRDQRARSRERRKERADFVHRVTLQLNSLYREGTVEKIGSEMEACAKAAPDENAEPTTVLRALFGLAGSIVPRCR
jgi:hypothetical protein